MKRFFRAVAILFLGAPALSAAIEPCEVLVAHSEGSQGVATRLSNFLNGRLYDMTVRTISARDFTNIAVKAGGGCPVVTTDPAAFDKAVFEMDDTQKLIATFITEETFKSSADHGQATAVYYNANPDQVIGLLDQLLPREKNIVFLGTPALPISDPHQSIIQNHIAYLQADSPSDFLRQIAYDRSTDFYVATPAFAHLNSNTIRPFLDLLQRKGQGLVGYSQAMTRVGAMLSVFPDEHEIFLRTEQAVLQLSNGADVKPQFANSHRWTENQLVAEILNINLDNQTHMRRLELLANTQLE